MDEDTYDEPAQDPFGGMGDWWKGAMPTPDPDSPWGKPIPDGGISPEQWKDDPAHPDGL